MNILEIKEKLTSLAEEYHPRDLNDPEIWKLDPEGFLFGWDALELIPEIRSWMRVFGRSFGTILKNSGNN